MIDVLARSLVHLIWQGALVAVVVEVALRGLKNAPAEARYRLVSAALGGMLALPPITGLWVWSAPSPAVGGSLFLGPAPPAAWTVGVVAAWLLGVLLLGSRTALGLVGVRRLRRASIAAPPALTARFLQLQRSLGLRNVDLCLISNGLVPMAVGWLRPAVLLPASLLVRLPPDQIEALLLHELAHVRRWDWLFNVLQTLAETLLFFHPATWWLSARIRHEREMCCDEAVLAAGTPALSYARALTELASLRALSVPAANGGDLMHRILNILGDRPPTHRAPWVLPVLLLGGVVALTTGAAADPLDAVAAVVPDEVETEGQERPVAIEDVGARALEMLSDRLDAGADALQDRAAARHERRAAHKRERAVAPPQASVRVRVHAPDDAAPYEAARQAAEEVRRGRELERSRVRGVGADCQHIVVGGTSITVCEGGTAEGVSTVDWQRHAAQWEAQMEEWTASAWSDWAEDFAEDFAAPIVPVPVVPAMPPMPPSPPTPRRLQGR